MDRQGTDKQVTSATPFLEQQETDDSADRTPHRGLRRERKRTEHHSDNWRTTRVFYGLAALILVTGLFAGANSLVESGIQIHRSVADATPYEEVKIEGSPRGSIPDGLKDGGANVRRAAIKAANALDAQTEAGSATRTAIVRSLDFAFYRDLGYTPGELGVNADAYATWMLAHFSYDVQTVMVFDDHTATVAIDAIAPSGFAIERDAAERIRTYLDGIGLIAPNEHRPLTAEQQAEVEELFQFTLNLTDIERTAYTGIELTKSDEDGTWTVSDAELDKTMETVFDLFKKGILVDN